MASNSPHDQPARRQRGRRFVNATGLSSQDALASSTGSNHRSPANLRGIPALPHSKSTPQQLVHSFSRAPPGASPLISVPPNFALRNLARVNTHGGHSSTGLTPRDASEEENKPLQEVNAARRQSKPRMNLRARGRQGSQQRIAINSRPNSSKRMLSIPAPMAVRVPTAPRCSDAESTSAAAPEIKRGQRRVVQVAASNGWEDVITESPKKLPSWKASSAAAVARVLSAGKREKTSSCGKQFPHQATPDLAASSKRCLTGDVSMPVNEGSSGGISLARSIPDPSSSVNLLGASAQCNAMSNVNKSPRTNDDIFQDADRIDSDVHTEALNKSSEKKSSIKNSTTSSFSRIEEEFRRPDSIPLDVATLATISILPDVLGGHRFPDRRRSGAADELTASEDDRSNSSRNNAEHTVNVARGKRDSESIGGPSHAAVVMKSRPGSTRRSSCGAGPNPAQSGRPIVPTHRTPSTHTHNSEKLNGQAAQQIARRASLEKYHASLTQYEKQEILSYPAVFYAGKLSCKVQPSTRLDAHNFGFDDNKGNYIVKIGDHIAYRYEIRGQIGSGTFGDVVSALDHKTNRVVAVKIIRNQPKFTAQGAIEVELLKTLNKKDPDDTCNVIRILGDLMFRNHQVIIVELLGENLYEACRRQCFRPMRLSVIRIYATQLLTALCLLQKCEVVHCDLKPENILICRDGTACRVKLIDFGSGCLMQKQIHTYIQSRFYRAPEVILGLQYTPAIDMWSFGCVLAELANGYPIFPGENEEDQLQRIMEFMGVPPPSFIANCPRKKYFFDSRGSPYIQLQAQGRSRYPGTKDINTFLKVQPSDDNGFSDFVRRCLEYIPEKRMTPADALNHRWIKGVACNTNNINNEQFPTLRSHNQSPLTTAPPPDCVLPPLFAALRR